MNRRINQEHAIRPMWIPFRVTQVRFWTSAIESERCDARVAFGGASGEMRSSRPAIRPSAASRPGAAKKSILAISDRRLRKRATAVSAAERISSDTGRELEVNDSLTNLRTSEARA